MSDNVFKMKKIPFEPSEPMTAEELKEHEANQKKLLDSILSTVPEDQRGDCLEHIKNSLTPIVDLLIHCEIEDQSSESKGNNDLDLPLGLDKGPKAR